MNDDGIVRVKVYQKFADAVEVELIHRCRGEICTRSLSVIMNSELPEKSVRNPFAYMVRCPTCRELVDFRAHFK